MDEDVVVSGLSGRLPECHSVEEFAARLLAGEDLVTADARRWPPGLLGLPARAGKLPHLEHFDAGFFGVHGRQAQALDPKHRLLLEVAHEAMVDAGLNPAELRGSRTGVFVGVSEAESAVFWLADPGQVSGFELTGNVLSMTANRISYAFDLRGPSLAVDTACSSSLTALALATEAMRAGRCDAALVASAHLCLRPAFALTFHRLGMLSPAGCCASFDASADGYARSEAALVLLLQRRSAARRLYATVRAACINTDGAKEQGITYPSGDMQRRLALRALREARLAPDDVAYVEAHGTGTKVGDPEEVNAIADVYCRERSAPLLMGSVKSNMGHAEPASGLCAVAKVLIAMERGVIPANLHYHTPNPDIPALSDGRIQVVARNTAWPGGAAVVNSFGFGGANAIVVLESDSRARPPPASYPVPRLVLASGRTEDAVRALLQHAHAHATDAELHALLDAVHALPVAGHTHRGYRLLLDPPLEEVQEYEAEPRPVWFVFSGMGSQWAGMARALLALPVFAASVARSAAALRPHGLDLLHVLTEAPEAAFDDVINSFVSIAAVQVALVDVLRELGVHPDGIVGHSVGEIGCAYADETLTVEQAVLCAYWRGRSIVDAALAPGAMAAVGLSWEQCAARCPPGVVPACHNAADSVTVSGPEREVAELVSRLGGEGVFARTVRSAGVAFHSPMVAAAAPLLRRRLDALLPHPRPRSARWLSSSLPPHRWRSDLAKLSDAAYHVNNLVSPVLFAEALQVVPARSVVVELSPHALLAPLLRRSLPVATHVPLVRREGGDPVTQLLAGVGRLYSAGCQPQAGRVYGRAGWPVSRGTPGLGAHVRWEHGAAWRVADYVAEARAAGSVVEVELGRAEDAYLAGHRIAGRVLFPAAGYLMMVWRTVASLRNTSVEETGVEFEDVVFTRVTLVPREGVLRFRVAVLPAGGRFEVSEGGVDVASGRVTVRPASPPARPASPPPEPSCGDLAVPLSADDIYKQLRVCGYQYEGAFRSICDSEPQLRRGTLHWTGDWVPFLDGMLQYNLLDPAMGALFVAVGLRRVLISPGAQRACGARVPLVRDMGAGEVRAGGVTMRGLRRHRWERPEAPAAPELERYEFVPYCGAALSPEDAVSVCVQVLAENASELQLRVLEVAAGRGAGTLLLARARAAVRREPRLRWHLALAASATHIHEDALNDIDVEMVDVGAVGGGGTGEWDCVACAGGEWGDVALRARILRALRPAGYLLLAAHAPPAPAELAAHRLRLLTTQAYDGGELVVARREDGEEAGREGAGSEVVEVCGAPERWQPALVAALQRAHAAPHTRARVYAVARDWDSGVLGLGTCLHAELGARALRVYLVPGVRADFAPDAPEFAAQVLKDLAVNVLRDGQWGSYRHLPLARRLHDHIQAEHAHVITLQPGNLSSLRWVESELCWAHERPAAPGTDLCRVHYAALNFRDVMVGSGRLPAAALPAALAHHDCQLGLEFSGRSSCGARVMGMVAARGLATSVLADEGLLWEVPAAWSLEQAATVPVAYATAYYALAVRGRIRRGETVLVHAGAGGVGQAAIAVALHAGCTVFTTVGSADKRAYLRERFPALPEDHIGHSRDASFERWVMRGTGGRGVDLVLNSLAQELLLVSLRCLAPGGRFLEIGKFDLAQDAPLGMSVFLKNITFHGIVLDALCGGADGEYEADRTAVARCLAEGVAAGAVRPLPATVYSEDQLEQAFRHLASGRHVGKLLVRVRGESDAPGHTVAALPRTLCRPAACYVIVGGLGGFGLELAKWLVTRGATRLVLNSRSGVRTGYQAWCVRRMRAAGATVLVSTADACSEAGARDLLREAAALGPPAAVFNLAAVLRDALFFTLTPDDFRVVAKPKIDCTRALDAATRDLAPELEHFVVFSSMSCGRGHMGQAAYGLANAAMERLVERRRADGLPALALQWGPIGEVGMLAEASEKLVSEVGGMAPQSLASCLQVMDGVLSARCVLPAVMGSMVPAERAAAAPAPRDLVQQAAQILGVRAEGVSDEATLGALGLDSLTAAEMSRLLETRGVALRPHELRTLTWARLRHIATPTLPLTRP